MNEMMNIIKYKKVYLLISLGLLLPGIISLIIFGLNLSIDFKGGSVLEYKFSTEPEISEIEEVIKIQNIEIVSLNKNDETFVLRTVPIESSVADALKASLNERFQGVEQLSFETIGPAVGKETTKNAFIALGWAVVGILAYIAYAFRNVPKPYSSLRFGVSAIIAMIHDAVMVIGIFSLLGHFFGVEVDSLFITAVLTVIGFSVHDTIVVFDRIRENLRKLPKTMDFESVVNYSIVETIGRSFATSLTVVITLSSLFLLGGQSIKVFVLTMLIGIISGTYSSIFTASPILVIWENITTHKKTKK